MQQELPGSNIPAFTVSEISGKLKRTLEDTFGHVRIRGELSGFKRAASGHLYFGLKDEKSLMDGVMWKGVAGRLTFRPEDGLEVIATGKVTAYGARSKYQIVVDRMEPAGAGALMALLEQRRKMLAAEGLFEPMRKRPIPFLPQTIGVVTSPTGAVIRDILHRLSDRFPRRVLLWPVIVQGDGAAEQVTAAIQGFNRMTGPNRPDLLIVARGGGSIEDLWAFNEESVVRAAAASDIPLISAVGHETDTTLIDYVSDLRAPTPTAAAEHAVPVRLELLAWSESQGARLMRGAGQAVQLRRQRLNDLSRALPRPEGLLDTPRQRLDRAGDALPRALMTGVQQRQIALSRAAAALRPATLRQMLENRSDRLRNLSSRLSPRPLAQEVARRNEQLLRLASRLEAAQALRLERAVQKMRTTGRQLEILSYKATLERGYAVVRDGDQIVTRRKEAAGAQNLSIEFADGPLQISAAVAGAPSADLSGPQPPKEAPE